MIQFLKSLTPKTRIWLAFLLGGTVILLFGMTLAGFLSTRRTMERVHQYNRAVDLARQTEANFQSVLAEAKDFTVSRDEADKEETLGYFKKARESFDQLSRMEEDPEGKTLLSRLGVALHGLEITLGVMTSKGKKSDSPGKLFSRYLKDVPLDFGNASQAYMDYLENKIRFLQSKGASQTQNELLFSLVGAFLALVGMGINYSITHSLNQALRNETVFQERFERFSEVTKEGILFHENGIIVDVNSALLEMTGFEAKDMIGQDILAFLGKETAEKARRMRTEGYPTEPYEITVLRRDGTEFPAEAHGRYFEFEGRRIRVVSLWNNTERKKAEKALRDSEEKFRNLIENSHDIISISGRDTGMSYISSSVKRVLGYDPSERIGKGYLQIMHPDDREYVKAEFAKLLETKGVSWTIEFRVMHKDGSWRNVESTGINLLENSSVRGIVYNLRDITEKKKAEGTLRKQERYFQALIEKSYDATVLIGRDGLVLYASPGMKAIYGFDPEERVGRSSLELLHPDDKALTESLFNKLLQKPGGSEIVLVRFRHKAGHYVTVDVRATNLLDDPDVGGIVVNYRDVSEKKKVEEALRQSEAKFRGLIENSYDLITLLDPQGRRIYESPSLERILGYKPGERKGVTFDTQPPEDQEKARKIFAEALAHPGAPYKVELRARHKDGHLINAEMILTNLLNDPAVGGIVVNGRDVTAKVKAEEALRKSEEHFRNLIEKSHDVISLIQKDGLTSYVSPSVKKVLGYDPDERFGRPFQEIVHPEDLQGIQSFFEYLIRNPNVTVTSEARVRHKDGRWRQVEGSATNLLGNPDIAAIILNYRDITEKVEAQEERRRSEENFRNLIEKAPDAVLVTQNEKIVYVNPKILNLLGYDDEEELLGKPGSIIVHPEDQKIVAQRVNTLAEGGKTYPAEIRLLRRDGAVLPAETSSIGIQFQGKAAVMVMLRDVTGRKQAEAAARENQERYRSLVESMPDAVMVHDEENILFVNPAAVRMFGAGHEEELLGKPFWMIVPPEFQEAVMTRIKATIERGTFNEPVERKLRRLDQSIIDVLVTSGPFSDRGRRVVLAIFSDITARKEAERKAQRYQRLAALGEMAAGMAHEIRNPTAAISAQAQYLLKKTGEGSPSYDQLRDIIQQCDRLDTLVHDTLDYSPERKFEERTEIPAKDLLQKALWLAQTQFGPSHARVQVELDLPHDLPTLKVHPTRMERVLVNLILNAFQAMPNGGKLLLRAGYNEKRVVLRVEDNGKGITDAEMSRLFEPFFTSRKMGSGLGLSICQKIVEEHQGQIRVERMEPHGAAFVLDLPLPKEKIS